MVGPKENRAKEDQKKTVFSGVISIAHAWMRWRKESEWLKSQYLEQNS